MHRLFEDANARPTVAGIANASRISAGNLLLFHQDAETMNEASSRPVSIDSETTVLTNLAAAKRPGMIGNGALFHDNDNSS